MTSLNLTSDLDLNYEVKGDAQNTLLLINGMGLPMQFWGDLAERLSRSFRVIQFDQRNAGKSQYVGNFSLNDIAGDAARLLDHLDIKQTTIMGHAWGGRVAQVFARDYPHLCKSIIICGTGGNFPPVDTGETQTVMRDAMRNGDRQTWEINLARQFCGKDFRLKNPEFFSKIADIIWLHRANKKAKWDAKISPSSSYWGLTDIPALLIYGEEDKNGTPENAKDLKQRLVNAELHMLADCGHFAIQEKQDEVFTLVNQFLTR